MRGTTAAFHTLNFHWAGRAGHHFDLAKILGGARGNPLQLSSKVIQ
jgi:hypothetical protein